MDLELTQAELAERAGVSTHYMQRIESGRALTLRTVVWLAQLFRVDASALFEPPQSRAPRGPGRPKKR